MPRSKYSRGKGKAIPLNLKIQLIQAVFENSKSVHQSAIEIGLKYSTAKAIVKRYRENNTLQRRNSRKLSLNQDSGQSEESAAELSNQTRNHNEAIEIQLPIPQRNRTALVDPGHFINPIICPEVYPFCPFIQSFYFWQMM